MIPDETPLDADSAPLPFPGKDEMNFAEFPIALVTDRAPKGQKSIKFEDQIYDPKRKKLITRRRIIDGSEEYGLPTATDDAVILALIQLTKQRSNFTCKEVDFTRLELLKLLGWADEGKNFERIKLSLLRIANVTYNYENAWWDNRQKTWTTKAFHIIETVEINDSRGHQNGLFPSRIVWNEVVFDSFQASFIRDIDFALCIRLEHPTALRMYRFLGKRFHAKPEWVFDLKEFAFEHIGLNRNYEGGTQIARKLAPALQELEEAGFLEPLSEAERFCKKGREWTIRLVQRQAPALAAIEDAPPASEPSPVIAELVSRGVTKTTAEELADKHTPESIRQKIEVFDWLIEAKDKRIARSPAGYLVKSITAGYATPAGFVPASERTRQKALSDKERRDAEARRHQEQQQKARQRAEDKAIAAYWTGLSLEEKKALEAQAEAEAEESPESFSLMAEPIKRLGRQIRRDAYIRKLLTERGELAPTE